MEVARNMPMDFFGIIWWMRQYFICCPFLMVAESPPDGRIPACPLETSWPQNFLQRNLPAYI